MTIENHRERGAETAAGRITPEMLAAGWEQLRRAGMPRLGPGPGLKEAYLAMAALDPAVSDAYRKGAEEMLEAAVGVCRAEAQEAGDASGFAIGMGYAARAHALSREEGAIRQTEARIRSLPLPEPKE